MPNDPITAAVRSVLGEFTSPETAARLSAVLRPIHGEEAAKIADTFEARASDAPARTAMEIASVNSCRLSGQHIARIIRSTMCQPKGGASDA